MSKLKNSVHLVNATSWVHPEDLKAYEKKVRNFGPTFGWANFFSYIYRK